MEHLQRRRNFPTSRDRFDYLQNEDARTDKKTRKLFDDWKKIERKADALRIETERLRGIKDDAKRTVLKNFPHLFQDSNLSDDVSSISDSNSLSASESRNQIPDRLGLSTELRDVYKLLQEMKKNDDHSETSRRFSFEPSTGPNQVQSNQPDFRRSPLGNLLNGYKSEQMVWSENAGEKEPVPTKASSSLPYGFIPVPVDYETYCRWMNQCGQSGFNGFPIPLIPTGEQGPTNKLADGATCQEIEPQPSVKQSLPNERRNIPGSCEPVLDIEDGEDTSQDAADLASSHSEPKKVQPLKLKELRKEPIKEVLVEVHPTAKLEPSVIPTTAQEKEKEKVVEELPVGSNAPHTAAQKTNSKLEEEQTFIMESDNVDEKLYSSESTETSTEESSQSELNDRNKMAVKGTNGKQTVRFSSTSSQSVGETPPKIRQQPIEVELTKTTASVTRTGALNFQSDSDTPEPPVVHGGISKPQLTFPTQSAEDLEISGPENELDDDDFWN